MTHLTAAAHVHFLLKKIDLPKAIRDVHMHAILEQVYVKREMQLQFCRHSVKREENVPQECRSRAFK